MRHGETEWNRSGKQQEHLDWPPFARATSTTAFPKGESIRDRYERTVAAIEKIAAGHPGERVVVVAHGGILDSVFRRAVGIDPGAPRPFELLNASTSTFFIEEDRWILGTWGDVAHLAGIPTMDDW